MEAVIDDPNIKVVTTDSMLGQQQEVGILSTVRHDETGSDAGVGFLSDTDTRSTGHVSGRPKARETLHSSTNPSNHFTSYTLIYLTVITRHTE